MLISMVTIISWQSGCSNLNNFQEFFKGVSNFLEIAVVLSSIQGKLQRGPSPFPTYLKSNGLSYLLHLVLVLPKRRFWAKIYLLPPMCQLVDEWVSLPWPTTDICVKNEVRLLQELDESRSLPLVIVSSGHKFICFCLLFTTMDWRKKCFYKHWDLCA